MQKEKIYGELSAEDFDLGDIVEWRAWDSKLLEWISYYGVVTDIKAEIISNRLVCICSVLPMDGNQEEKELFSMSLKIISRANDKNEQKFNC
tara:strand:+ start:157 stop:432 length:276 start_codon:yes stop_codon:yes gene_type:complete